MNKIFDLNIPVQTTEIPRNLKVTWALHRGKTYKAIGTSMGEELSSGERTIHVLAVICMVVGSLFTLFIPFLYKDFRNALFSRIEELSIDHKINVHYRQIKDEDRFIAVAIATDIFGFSFLYSVTDDEVEFV